MKWNVDNPMLTKILSVIIAIFLFMFVSYEGKNHTDNVMSGSSSHSVTEVLTNIPVEVDIDNEKYFATGIPNAVSIRLDGPQSVITQTVVTQNFTVKTPDLTELGVGTHKIELFAEGFSEELNYNLSPAVATIRVEEKLSQQYDVDVNFDRDEYVARGYDVEGIDLSEKQVTISGAESTLSNIHEVKAIIQPNQTNITSSFNVEARVVVLNKAGEPLNVNVSPSTVDASVNITSRKKEVAINLEQTGKIDPRFDYNISLATNELQKLEVSGDYDKIAAMEEIDVDVDLSGITESTTREVPIVMPDGVDEMSRNKVNVKINVQRK